ncbi:MAG TPA: Ldh family oxidoreductase [Chloroflexota bacterium]|jgi:LDH2 family malate/lactate/ureidoglycolate dehydrogenase|nr:Ldh family oxidoreductase [Chloroflexota bacterium]
MAQTATSTRTVTADSLRRVVSAMFEQAGMPPGDAQFMGECLVDADLRGVHSHGTRYVVNYVRALKKGDWNPTANIRAVREHHATAIVDADRGAGHLAGRRAMGIAIEKAKRYGTATVLVRNSRHCGALAYYTQMAADAGCIGFASTTAGRMMAPWGGVERIIALNPLSWAAPTDKPWSVNLDMATSVVAGSKLGMAIEKGEKIPLGWALDEHGQPTDDPTAALKGTLLPIGGPKGYGMSVVLDIISGVLGGAGFGKGLGGPGGGHCVQATDVEAFMPLDEFKRLMGQLVDQIKSSSPAPGSAGIFLPGEIEHANKTRRLESGIPMTAGVLDELERAASELGISQRPEDA